MPARLLKCETSPVGLNIAGSAGRHAAGMQQVMTPDPAVRSWAVESVESPESPVRKLQHAMPATGAEVKAWEQGAQSP